MDSEQVCPEGPCYDNHVLAPNWVDNDRDRDHSRTLQQVSASPPAR
jgi:hypothetical protein